MQLVVTAMDFTDSDALSHRLACREVHLAGGRKMIAKGTFLSGGAILDGDNRMIGSTVHVQFENRTELDAWLASDPYNRLGAGQDRCTRGTAGAGPGVQPELRGTFPQADHRFLKGVG
jgi:uncharacterized protein YciI